MIYTFSKQDEREKIVNRATYFGLRDRGLKGVSFNICPLEQWFLTGGDCAHYHPSNGHLVLSVDILIVTTREGATGI